MTSMICWRPDKSSSRESETAKETLDHFEREKMVALHEHSTRIPVVKNTCEEKNNLILNEEMLFTLCTQKVDQVG